METKIIIFAPSSITKKVNSYLSGYAEYLENEKAVSFYITDLNEKQPNNLFIGVLSSKNSSKSKTFLQLQNEHGQILIKNAVFNSQNIVIDSGKSENFIFLYEHNSFINHKLSDDVGSLFINFQSKLLKIKPKSSYNLSTYLLSLVCFLMKLIDYTMPVIKYSSVGVHIRASLSRLEWACNEYRSSQNFSVKLGNFIVSFMLDLILAKYFLDFVSSITSTEDFPALFLWTCEYCVASLKQLLEWLAGSPAGFKLNFQFNSLLASFFLFHTEVWWMFLVFISPGLTYAFQVFTFLGRFGLTFQAAIFSDLLALVTFHAYCIYAYAAKLYHIQLSSLTALWRLFLGRKWNPLRDKDDPYHYSADQLFVGTLCFTILLFLLPTTLIYYIVFTTSRIVIVYIGGVLNRLRVILHGIPIYSSLLWLFSSPRISPQILFDLDVTKSSNDLLVFKLKRVPLSFMSTMRNSLPDCLDMTAGMPDRLLHILLTGELLYPF